MRLSYSKVRSTKFSVTNFWLVIVTDYLTKGVGEWLPSKANFEMMVVVLPTIIHLQNTDIKPEITHHSENDNFWHLVLQVWIQYLVPVHTNIIIYFLVWSDNPIKLETTLQ